MDEKYLSFLNQIDDENSNIDKNSKVLIIDGLNTFIRSYSVNPALNDDGMHIGGISGFLKSIRYAISINKPSRCIIVFDGKDGSKRRQKLYPEYKQNRKVKKRLNRHVDWSRSPVSEEESMTMQMSRLIQYLEYLPLTLICVDGIEADDGIAYISKQILNDSKITIMSTDKDFLQLVDNRIGVWSPTKKKLYTPDTIFEEFGIPSRNLLTYRILDGDKSDNISGIKGAGLKSIIKYIPQISIDKDFTAKDLIEFANNTDSTSKLLSNIKNGGNTIKINYLLMQLSDVDISNYNKLRLQDGVSKDIQSLVKHKFQLMFIKDKLNSQIQNLDSWMKEFLTLDRYRKASD